MIVVEHAEKLVYNDKQNAAQRFLGNVQIHHENTTMYCDSAWLFGERNEVLAFGRIHIKQGDTLNIYGDSLHYAGNTHQGKMRGHVRLVEQDMHLETDSIEFNTEDGTAWYNNWGTITSVKDHHTLRSKSGSYHSASKEIFFKDSVSLRGKDFEMYGDTLIYKTTSATAFFHGPTVIRSEGIVIYTDKGWYDTRKDKSLITGNNYILNEQFKISGDTILYDKKTSEGVAHGYFEAIDTANDMILSGRYGIFNQKKGRMLATKDALMTKIFDTDSFYLHADTLIGIKDQESGKQSTFAYHHVRFYKTDIQGKCDSVTYFESDSLVRLFGKPVIWHENNQMSADHIYLKIFDKKLDKIVMEENCFIASQVDTTGFNQIKGKKVVGQFDGDELKRVNIYGNGQTIYYVGEKDKPLVGMNKLDCTDITLYLENKKIDRIHFIEKPDAVFYPIDKINPKDKKLKDFIWVPQHRPLSKADLFTIR